MRFRCGRGGLHHYCPAARSVARASPLRSPALSVLVDSSSRHEGRRMLALAARPGPGARVHHRRCMVPGANRCCRVLCSSGMLPYLASSFALLRSGGRIDGSRRDWHKEQRGQASGLADLTWPTLFRRRIDAHDLPPPQSVYGGSPCQLHANVLGNLVVVEEAAQLLVRQRCFHRRDKFIPAHHRVVLGPRHRNMHRSHRGAE